MTDRVCGVTGCYAGRHNAPIAATQGTRTVATSPGTMEFLLDVLAHSKQVSARRMFGEYCLYYAGRPVGLVCDEQLFLKPSDAGLRLMQEPDLGAPFPGARPHLATRQNSCISAKNPIGMQEFVSVRPPGSCHGPFHHIPR